MGRSNKIAGTTSVVAGQGDDVYSFDVAGTHSIKPGSITREALVGTTGVAGFVERHEVPHIEIEVYDRQSLSLIKLSQLDNVTITSSLSNGKNYVLHGWLANSPELSGTDGTFTLRFEGTRCQEINVSS